MTLLEQVRARLTELRAQLDTNYTERGALIDTAAAERRGFTDAEQTRYDQLGRDRAAVEQQVTALTEREAELAEQERRQADQAAVRREAGPTGEQSSGPARTEDPAVYVRDGRNGRSYFRDLARAQVFGDTEALDNLQRHARQRDAEQRALGNTNTTGGSGGEFAPPTWLVSDYIKLARMGRTTADLFNSMPVPVGTSSVALPRVLTGTAVALQSSQNSTLASTDLTTGSVSTGFSTIGGKQVVSQQLLDQSAIDFDRVVTQDLAAAYAQNLGNQVIYGAGTGANNNAVVNGLVSLAINAALQVTFTSGTPTAAAFYSKCAGAISAFVTTRLDQPDTWLMHPRRYYWLLAQVDSSNRPLVVPQGIAFNAMATQESGDTVKPAGATGMTFLGLPIYIDPQLPTNLGAGTNQDEVFLLKRSDLWLFESEPRAEVFREPYAESVGVLFRLYSYVGTILNRYPTSVATVNGTGLIAPTF